MLQQLEVGGYQQFKQVAADVNMVRRRGKGGGGGGGREKG